MHRCSNSHGNSVSPCSCGWFPAATSSNSFSMLFSMPNHQYQSYDEVISDSYPLSSSSSAVDCTLSLGTPSTRQIDNHNRKSGSCVSNLCWDLFQSKKSSSYKHSTSSGRGGGGGGGSSSGSNTTSTIHNNLNTGDPLLARRCANCDTTSTPLWRNGPRGPKSLCNACGIRYKKEERRASSNATAAAMEQQQHHHHYSSWAHSAQSQRVASMSSGSIGNHEFKFIEEDDQCRSSDTTGIPFISWRLNVPDRHSSLVHDYT